VPAKQALLCRRQGTARHSKAQQGLLRWHKDGKAVPRAKGKKQGTAKGVFASEAGLP